MLSEKSQTKEWYIIHASLMDILERAKQQRQKSDQWLQRAEKGRKRLTTKEHSGIFWSDGNVLYLDKIKMY